MTTGGHQQDAMTAAEGTSDAIGEPRPVARPGVTDRRELSKIAYGFMASKALFAALGIDLFTHLAAGPRTATELSSVTGVAPNRLQTLLHALAGLGLVVVDQRGYANAPVCQRHLVRGAPGDYGDYFRLQIAQQIYPALLHLDAGLTGTAEASDTMAGLLASPEQARTFTTAQHAGSLGPARALANRVALGGAPAVLDVGGGSGAFSIALCERNTGLQATVLDFPAVLEVARECRDRAGLADRICLLAADAVHDPWPSEQDVVLMSYLLSALGDAETDVVLRKARASLRPGGLLIVHDFMLHDRPGPELAALWFLQYVAYRSDCVAFSAAALAARLRNHDLAPVSADVLIPGITKVVQARTAPA